MGRISDWLATPIVLRPLKPNNLADWLLYRSKPGPAAYWIAMGVAFAFLALVVLSGGK